MGFLEALREYLQGVAAGPVPEASLSDPQLQSARRAFLDVGDRLREQPDSSGPRLDEWEAWQSVDAIVRFAPRFQARLAESVWSAASEKKRKQVLHDALRLRFGLATHIESASYEGELDRLVGLASSGLPRTAWGVRLDIYSEETSLAARGKVLAPGQILLQMRGRRDPTRWLLHLEAAQAFGPSDPWRLARETAQWLITDLSSRIWRGADSALHISRTTVNRLDGLGLISGNHALPHLVEVTPIGLELLREIVEDRPSPLSLMTRSLIADLTNDTLRSKGTFEEAVRTVETDALVRTMRMVTHELRNTLLPARVALSAARASRPSGPDEAFDVVAAGLERAMAFVDELAVLRAAAGPLELVDVHASLRAATTEIRVMPRLTVRLDVPGPLPFVRADRVRLVRAFVNLFRNAEQARETGPVHLLVTAIATDDARSVELRFDDDGPGVPPEHRRAIFEEGFSLRPQGTGLGLAFVRDVVDEIGGRIEYAPSPSGGARFLLNLPAVGGENP